MPVSMPYGSSRGPLSYLGHSISRRGFAKLATGVSCAALMKGQQSFAAAPSNDAHFILHLCISGGVDATYTFDARPLAFTDAGLQQNYGYRNADPDKGILEDPTPRLYVGSNGCTTLRSPITDILAPHLADFSILNGVVMSPALNGHGSNMYYLFSNSIGPADSFMPLIGQLSDCPLESVHFGGFEGDGNQGPTNFGNSVQLSYGQGAGLAADLVSNRRVSFQSPFMSFIQERMTALSVGDGRFSLGAAALGNSFARSPQLGQALVDAGGSSNNSNSSNSSNDSCGSCGSCDSCGNGDNNAGGDVSTSLRTALAYFSGGVTKSATIMVDRDPVIDVHGSDSAQGQVPLYQELTSTLAQVFSTLKGTPFRADAGLSFFDVTTVLVTSEFSRTMRSLGEDSASIDATGTDHNPFSNTLLIGGKGIRPGLVIGSSDCDQLNAQRQFERVSGAHLSIDQSLKLHMGKPFDPRTGRSVDVMPTEFRQMDYLNFPSVTNTLFQLFGLPSQKFLRIGTQTAPIISSLLY